MLLRRTEAEGGGRRHDQGLLHHADTVIIEGRSFRMKDQIEQ